MAPERSESETCSPQGDAFVRCSCILQITDVPETGSSPRLLFQRIEVCHRLSAIEAHGIARSYQHGVDARVVQLLCQFGNRLVGFADKCDLCLARGSCQETLEQLVEWHPLAIVFGYYRSHVGFSAFAHRLVGIIAR